jgi:hypothetical protein
MNGVRQVEEINRAKEEIARLTDCVKSRRVRMFSRDRLLRLQTDLAMLVASLGEVQRIVSVSMIQRGYSDAAGASVRATNRPPEGIESRPLDGRAPSVPRIFTGRPDLNLRDLNGDDGRLNWSMVKNGTH